MLDPSTAKRFNESCTEAAQGYCVATGAAYAALSTAWFQSVIEALEAVRPGRSEADPPKSWYRHPDRIDLVPRREATTAWPNVAFQEMIHAAGHQTSKAGASTPWDAFATLARLNPMAEMFLAAARPAADRDRGPSWPVPAAASIPAWPMLAPLPGWWNFRATRHPAVTWPMAYGMTLAGVPNAVAWPFAEANAAALDAAQTAVRAFSEAMEPSHSAEATRCPTCDQTRRQSQPRTDREQDRPSREKSPAASEAASPFDLAISVHAAGVDAWMAWIDGFGAAAKPAQRTKGTSTRH